ncbi:MAG: hypothetical protein QXS20_10330 [Candidatus Thorarchaeota archaeon]
MPSDNLTACAKVSALDRRVEEEILTIRDLMDSFGRYRLSPGPSIEFQIHRLCRALRIHYLALKHRDASILWTEPDMSWELSEGEY